MDMASPSKRMLEQAKRDIPQKWGKVARDAKLKVD